MTARASLGQIYKDVYTAVREAGTAVDRSAWQRAPLSAQMAKRIVLPIIDSSYQQLEPSDKAKAAVAGSRLASERDARTRSAGSWLQVFEGQLLRPSSQSQLPPEFDGIITDDIPSSLESARSAKKVTKSGSQ